MSIIEKEVTIWSAQSADMGGNWQRDAVGGLLSGIVRVPVMWSASISIYGSNKLAKSTISLDHTTIGKTTLNYGGTDHYGMKTYIVTSEPGATEGIWLINAMIEMDDGLPDSSYTKDETRELLLLKSDKASTYTKTESQGLVSVKADKTAVYTKTEADAKFAPKA